MAEINQGSDTTQRTADHSAQQPPLSEIPAATKEILMTVLVKALPGLSSADLERVRAALDSELDGQTSEDQPLVYGYDTPLAKVAHHLSTDYSFTTRLQAVRALSLMGAEAVPTLITALGDNGIGEYAGNALTEIGKPALPGLIRALHNEGSPLLQVKAADVLGRIGAAEAVPALKEAMKKQERSVSRASALALGKIKDDSAVVALVDALQYEDLRLIAVENLMVQHVAATPALIWIAEDQLQDSSLRSIAINVLGLIGKESAIPSLIGALQDNNAEIRQEAAKALGLMECKSAVPALIERLRDPHAGVRVNVAQALGKIGDTNAIKPLKERLSSIFFRVEQDEYVRSALVDSIRELKNASPSSQPRRLRGITRIYP